MRIVFDFDHTLNNMLFVWVDTLNKRHGLQVKYEDIKDWDMEKNFPTLTSDEIDEPLYDPKYWSKINCWPNVGRAFNKLRSLGDEVFVASSTHPSYASIKYNNCMKSIIPVVTQNIIFTYRKDIIDCNVIVDDYPPNIANSKAHRILIDTPYNRIDDHPEYEDMYDVRVQDFDDAIQHIMSYHCIEFFKVAKCL